VAFVESGQAYLHFPKLSDLIECNSVTDNNFNQTIFKPDKEFQESMVMCSRIFYFGVLKFRFEWEFLQ
jgi:hypothetical protein